MEPLEVTLFGGFDLRCGGETPPPIPSRAARSLFAYLVMRRDVRHPRERLADQFWSDLPPARARRRLSHALWQIQDTLSELPTGGPYVEATSDSIGFSPDVAVWVDVEEFEQRFARVRARRADGRSRARDLPELQQLVDLYRGDFLSGHYDDWVVNEQERLEQRYLQTLTWLVSLAKSHGAYDDALLYARRLTNQDPLREDGHREVMRLSMLLGRTSDAIRQFERCREVLAEELGTEPAAITVQLYDRIVRQRAAGRSDRVPEPAPFPDRLPLVGRDRERTASVALLERALAGRGGTVLVEADPGVGKTRLLAEVVDDAHWRGFTVLAAACRGPEGAGPYAALQDLLEPSLTPLRVEQLRHRIDPVWLAQVATLLPAVRRALPAEVSTPAMLRNAEGAQRMRDALIGVVVALAELDPLLVVVDDLQWSDEESLALLDVVASHAADRRLVLMLGYRGGDARSRDAVWETIRGVDRSSRPERLLLGPLDAFSTAELVRVVGRGHHVDPAVATRLQRETGGNPLFVIETLRALAEDQRLDELERGDADQLPLPSSIRELVLSRLERLPTELRAVLDTTAIGGEGTDLDVLEAATELPRSTVADAVDVLLRHSLLREAGDAFALHHDQIRRVAVSVLSDGAREAIHRRLGEALEELRPRDIERLAHHFVHAELPRKAIGYLQRAGQAAAAIHAYATADGHYRRAVELQAEGLSSVASRFDLLAEHEAILDVLGDRERQLTAIEEMELLAAGEPRREIETVRRRAMLDGQLGELESAMATAREAVAAAQKLGDPGLLGPALVTLATMLAWAGRRAEAVPVLERATVIVEDPSVEAEVRTMLGSTLRELQRYDEAADELEQAVQVAERAGELRHAAHALGTLGTVRMEIGDLSSADDLYRRAIDRCRTLGFRRGQAIALGNRANTLYVSGRVGEALEAYDSALAVTSELSDQRTHALVLMNRANVRHAIAGLDDLAYQDALDALAFLRQSGDPIHTAHCLDTLAGIALRKKDAAHALGYSREALQEAERSEDDWLAAQAMNRQAEAYLLMGRESDASSAVSAGLERLERGRGFTDLYPVLLATQARVFLATGVPDAARSAMATAVDNLHPGVERRYLILHYHARALMECGEGSEAASVAGSARRELADVLDSLSPEDREAAAAIPEHRAILDASPVPYADRRLISVASADAPNGRPLAAHELVELALDLSIDGTTPEDPVERRRWLLKRVVDQILQAGGIATVSDLARVLVVSEATVRRDLQALRARGGEIPTRGRRTG